MTKLTAVEWVVDKLSLLNLEIHLHPEKYNVDEAIREKNKILQQSKAMEREQKEYFFNCGRQYQLTGEGTFTEVYNETYGGEQ